MDKIYGNIYNKLMADVEGNNILVAAPRVWPLPNGETIPKVRENYQIALKEAGLVAVQIHPGMSEKEIVERYTQCSGVLLIGGRDWDSHLYGQEPHPKNDEPDPEQDSNEQKVLVRALNDGVPILGICRGEQGIGIAVANHYQPEWKEGETPESLFIQHLGDVTNEEHSVEKYEDLEPNKHLIQITPGTIAHEIYRREVLEVVSGHHQALNKKALDKISALVVSGMSYDRIVEIIEMNKSLHRFCVGVQTHPEVLKEIRRPLFKRFAEESLSYASKRTFVFASR